MAPKISQNINPQGFLTKSLQVILFHKGKKALGNDYKRMVRKYVRGGVFERLTKTFLAKGTKMFGHTKYGKKCQQTWFVIKN